jgi:hypothetical protein
MREYSIKRGHNPNIADIIEKYFGVTGRPEQGICFEAEGIGTIHLRRAKGSIFIETEPQPDAAGGTETIKKWNDFLLELTGRTSKERKKRMEKKAKK